MGSLNTAPRAQFLSTLVVVFFWAGSAAQSQTRSSDPPRRQDNSSSYSAQPEPIQPAVGRPKSSPNSTALSYKPPGLDDSHGFRSMLSRIFVATIFVLIACCASIWLAKRYLARGPGQPGASSSLKVLATLHVSRRGCVQLLQADGTKLVVAIDGGALKSVIPLAEPFEHTLLDAVDEEVTAVRRTSQLEKTNVM